MRVMVVGPGGREHALAWALGRSERVERVYVAPGNAGTAHIATNLSIHSNDLDGLLQAAQEHAIDLTVVGPESVLAQGLVDAFEAAGLRVFGPTRAAAQLESSKAFAKQFMQETGIPTAAAATFSDYEAARAYVDTHVFPDGVVVKASGLAQGKGVIVCDVAADAQAALHQMMVEDRFGPSGQEVVIEERLRGPEVSVLAFCDGKRVKPLVPARDHKRAYDYDVGPNTGGMGAYAPPPDLGPGFVDRIVRDVLQPAVDGMAARGIPYVGVLYAGLMITADGPRVLEFNCRFGDPEAQVILPLLNSDLAEVMLACIAGRLDEIELQTRPDTCATVVMASPGYPGRFPTGLPISGVDLADQMSNVIVFHAATRLDEGGKLVTAGGRVLAVSAIGADLERAVRRAYAGVGHIQFENAQFRRDIGRAVPV